MYHYRYYEVLLGMKSLSSESLSAFCVGFTVYKACPESGLVLRLAFHFPCGKLTHRTLRVRGLRVSASVQRSGLHFLCVYGPVPAFKCSEILNWGFERSLG